MKMKHIKTEPAPVSGQHTLTIVFPSAEDHRWAERQIREQIKRGNGNQLAGASASILLCALSRASEVRACNCHDELVRALQMCANALKDHCQYDNPE